MLASQEYHHKLRSYLRHRKTEEAQGLWLELADKHSEEADFLLLLVNDFTSEGHEQIAGELASLLTPTLRSDGKIHEWLYSLKLQIDGKPTDKELRAQLIEAYNCLYEDDPRWKSIFAVSEIDQPRVLLKEAIKKIDTLLTLQVGAYCSHKSWGLGQVKQFDLALGRIVVSFPHNPDHSMQIAYAGESLVPVSTDHIEVRKLTDIDVLKDMVESEPVQLIRIVLLSNDRAATVEKIQETLSGSVIPGESWKKWWETTRKLLKKDSHFEMPSKKTEPVRLRSAPVSLVDELIDAFQNAVGMQQKTEVSRRLLKAIDDVENPNLLLQEFQDGLLKAVRNCGRERKVDQLEAVLVIEEIESKLGVPTDSVATILAQLLDDNTRLPKLLSDLSLPAQKRVVRIFRDSNPNRLLDSVNGLSVRVLDEISDLLPQIATRIEQLVRSQSASRDLLCWLCRGMVKGDLANWFDAELGPILLTATLNSIEDASSRTESKKLRDLLINEESLLTDLLAYAPIDVVRDIVRQIMGSIVFEELDRRSLIAKVVKMCPAVQDLLASKETTEQPLIVSRVSLQRRQAELEEIIQKKIPQNSKEIAEARSYGDLRENFEFKAAKDTQKLLMRRRAELEVLLVRSQPTDFSGNGFDSVQIGTSVVVADIANNTTETYHILGAWDSDPERGIVSYPAALAQQLLNKRVGDVVEFQSDTGTKQIRVQEITSVSDQIISSL